MHQNGMSEKVLWFSTWHIGWVVSCFRHQRSPRYLSTLWSIGPYLSVDLPPRSPFIGLSASSGGSSRQIQGVLLQRAPPLLPNQIWPLLGQVGALGGLPLLLAIKGLCALWKFHIGDLIASCRHDKLLIKIRLWIIAWPDSYGMEVCSHRCLIFERYW
jgi:hypothetical protein